MSQDPKAPLETETPPDNETPEEALARARRKTEALTTKIDAVEKDVSPGRPPVPPIGAMF